MIMEYFIWKNGLDPEKVQIEVQNCTEWKKNGSFDILKNRLDRNPFFLLSNFYIRCSLVIIPIPSKHVATFAWVVKCAPLEFTFRPTGQKTDTMATLDWSRIWPFFHFSAIFFFKIFGQILKIFFCKLGFSTTLNSKKLKSVSSSYVLMLSSFVYSPYICDSTIAWYLSLIVSIFDQICCAEEHSSNTAVHRRKIFIEASFI